MTTLDEREQQTRTKRCKKCGEVKPLEGFPLHTSSRDGRRTWCRVCDVKRQREARWKKQGIPPESWPRLHQEAEARTARRSSVPDGHKRCSRCDEVKPLEEFSPHPDTRDGRDSWCHVCKAKRAREAAWTKRGIPTSDWPRLHEEAERKAEARAARRSSVPDGHKRCSRCDKIAPLTEYPVNKRRRDGRDSWCRGCKDKCDRERHWTKKGIPASEWPRLHREADRQRRMRELAAQHGLKYCADCDMCLGRAFFYRASSRADGLQPRCKACASARHAAYLRTPAGRASSKGRVQRRRAKIQGLPTDGTGPRDWAAHAEEIEDFECHLCGGALEVDDEIHWDHLDPISTGSTGTVFHNMHAAHARCNLMRGNRTLEEWFAATGLLDVTV